MIRYNEARPFVEACEGDVFSHIVRPRWSHTDIVSTCTVVRALKRDVVCKVQGRGEVRFHREEVLHGIQHPESAEIKDAKRKEAMQNRTARVVILIRGLKTEDYDQELVEAIEAFKQRKGVK